MCNSSSCFFVVGIIWRGARSEKEGEPLVEGERGRGEEKGAEIQQDVATLPTKESTTCL